MGETYILRGHRLCLPGLAIQLGFADGAQLIDGLYVRHVGLGLVADAVPLQLRTVLVVQAAPPLVLLLHIKHNRLAFWYRSVLLPAPNTVVAIITQVA